MAGNKGGKKLNLLLPWAQQKERKAGDGLAVLMAAEYLHGLALCLILLAEVKVDSKGLGFGCRSPSSHKKKKKRK